jgi:glycosyltransferase involved in cell wall biosynthesis
MILDKIGIVVIGRNEGDRLINCLRSVQSNVKCLVYVDSGSSDGSTQAAERLGAYVVALNTNQPFTAARGRNEGFAVLRKLRPDIQFVQFIDGDCELDKNWLYTAAAFIAQRDDLAIVYGRRRERYPSASIYNRLCDIEWDTPVGQTFACGGDSLVRTHAFEAVGGFRAQLIAGEEPELCVRLRESGWKIWRLDAEMTRHDAAMTRFGQWWLRTTRFGYAMIEVLLLHWHSPFAIWKAELARVIFWVGILPALIGIATLMYPKVLVAALIYPLQVCRIAVSRGPASSDSWAYASFITLAKFAEFQGIMTYYWRRLHRRSIEWIAYK